MLYFSRHLCIPKITWRVKCQLYKLVNHGAVKFVFNKQVMQINRKNKLLQTLQYDYNYNANLGFLRQTKSRILSHDEKIRIF